MGKDWKVEGKKNWPVRNKAMCTHIYIHTRTHREIYIDERERVTDREIVIKRNKEQEVNI